MKPGKIIASLIVVLFVFSCNSCNRDCRRLEKKLEGSVAFSYFNYILNSYWELKEVNQGNQIGVVFRGFEPVGSTECDYMAHRLEIGINNSLGNGQVLFDVSVRPGQKPKVQFEQFVYDSTSNLNRQYRGESFFDTGINSPSNDFISLHFIEEFTYMNQTYHDVAVFTYNLDLPQLESYVHKLYLSKNGPVKVNFSDGREYYLVNSDYSRTDDLQYYSQ